MKKYTLLFRGGLDYENASPEQIQEDMVNWNNWIQQLAMAGKFSSGQRLDSHGTQVKGADRQVIDGPFVEGKEVIGGYLVIQAAGMDEAVEISKGCPIFDFGGLTEIREIAN